MPPSINSYLMPVAGKWKTDKRGRRYQQGRWIKTPVHREYMNQCQLWRIQNNKAFHKIKELIHWSRTDAEKKGIHFALRIDCFFVFYVEHIFTGNGKAQRLDADNRLKPCRDALSKLLEIDDRYFFAGNCEKVYTHTKESECTLIRIDQMAPRTIDQIKSLIQTELNPVS